MLKSCERATRFYCVLMIFSLEVVLALSAWGYFNWGVSSATFVPLVVLMAAYLFGRSGGAASGLLFAVLNMWFATTKTEMPGDLIFSPFFSGNLVATLVLALIPRVLFGFVAGVLYEHSSDGPHRKGILAAKTIVCWAFHLLLIIVFVAVLFPQTALVESPADVFLSPLLLMQVVIPPGVMLALDRLTHSPFFASICKCIDGAAKEGPSRRGQTRFRISLLALSIFLGLGVLREFAHDVTVLASTEDMTFTPQGMWLLQQLELQQAVAFFALINVSGAILMLVYMYSLGIEIVAGTDTMTGVYRRGAFVSRVNQRMKEKRQEDKPVFIMLDVDYFKKINDSYGHAIGDGVLAGVGIALHDAFGRENVIGRMGGDEFAVYCVGRMEGGELDAKISQLESDVAHIKLPDNQLPAVRVSVGMYQGDGTEDFDMLYECADKALYAQKVAHHNDAAARRAS